MISSKKRELYNYFKSNGLDYKVKEYEERYPELVEKDNEYEPEAIKPKKEKKKK